MGGMTTSPTLDTAALDAARAEFSPAGTYLNTATLGLPPRRSTDAVLAALESWRTGRSVPTDFDADVEGSRAAYAALVGVAPADVAVGSQVSVFAGIVAAAVPDGGEVLVPLGDFTSILFPFLAQAARGVTVREVPLEHIADEVGPRTSLVALSAVQSADGRVADLDALEAAVAGTGTRVLLDTTQAIGWLPVDAGRFTYTVTGGYKWLLAPRGTCFATVQRDHLDGLTPHAAGWYAGGERWSSLYGGPLRLATDARRLDVSPAWHSWAGQRPSLELLTEVGREALHVHSTGLANRFRAACGLAPGDSAIVSVATSTDVGALLESADIVASVRGGRLRLSFHVSTSEADADRAAEVLAGHVHD